MSKSKARGTKAETDLVKYLKAKGLKCERRALAGKNDKGDIAGLAHCVVEVKATRKYDFASMMNEACQERDNAAEVFPFGVQKRPGLPVAKWFVVTLVEDWVLNQKILSDVNIERLEIYRGKKELTKGAHN